MLKVIIQIKDNRLKFLEKIVAEGAYLLLWNNR